MRLVLLCRVRDSSRKVETASSRFQCNARESSNASTHSNFRLPGQLFVTFGLVVCLCRVEGSWRSSGGDLVQFGRDAKNRGLSWCDIYTPLPDMISHRTENKAETKAMLERLSGDVKKKSMNIVVEVIKNIKRPVSCQKLFKKARHHVAVPPRKGLLLTLPIEGSWFDASLL